MAIALTQYKVFISSPSGLECEKEAFYQEISTYDEIEARCQGISFWGIGSEKVPPDFGRPQSVINEHLYTCDYFVLLLWDRWGTPPGLSGQNENSSGCEEEFQEAVKCFNNKTMKGIVVLFKDVDNGRLIKPDEQLQKVLDFKKKLEEEKILFYQSFSNIEQLKSWLRRCMSKWIQGHKERIAKVPEENSVFDFVDPNNIKESS
jgi:hypothetical protein